MVTAGWVVSVTVESQESPARPPTQVCMNPTQPASLTVVHPAAVPNPDSWSATEASRYGLTSSVWLASLKTSTNAGGIGDPAPGWSADWVAAPSRLETTQRTAIVRITGARTIAIAMPAAQRAAR